MAIDPASIFESIKRGGLDASLFTSFNATLPFYEDVLLRKLTAVGCRNNVVLMDRRQCAAAYSSKATRPRLAGVAYTLVPVGIAGAFHPKLCLLAGKRRASVFVGSHNLTISGFGYNREVTNHVDLLGAAGSSDRAFISQAWMIARDWISSLGTDLPASLLTSAYALDRSFGTGTQSLGEQGQNLRLLAQHPGSAGLLEQLASLTDGHVRRITICGAFFDHDNALLTALANRWVDAEIIVGVEPSTVWMGLAPAHPRIRVVDVGKLGRPKQQGGYLHAKAIYVETDSTRVFASGSANPSAPAWMTEHRAPNVEAMLVRVGKDAHTCARALGMHALYERRSLNAAQLTKVVARSRTVDTEDEACPAIHVGIADQAGNIVRVAIGSLPSFDLVVALDELECQTVDADTIGITDDGFVVHGGLERVRTLQLLIGTNVVARILVHHPAAIAHRVNGAARESATQLLRQLGSQFDDISRIFPHLERVIFSETIPEAVGLPRHKVGVTVSADASAVRPDSLGISVSDIRKSSRPTLFCHSNDLAFFIDVLMHRIGVKDETSDPGVDAAGRSEEEQIGQDDAGDDQPLSAAQATEATDSQIAEAVAGKATRLARRMIKALQYGGSSHAETMVKVVQLVAVIALLRELAHLELADRWRRAHTNFLWLEDLQLLFEAATTSLLSNGSQALNTLSDEDLMPEEVAQLRQLLTWLAWMTDLSWYTPGMRVDAADIEDRAGINARLLELLPHVASDADQWSAVERSIEITTRIEPAAAIEASRWLSRHLEIGRRLSNVKNGPRTIAEESFLPIRPGDIVDVPGVIGFAAIAINVDVPYVAVEVGLNKPRRFQLDRVRLLGRI